MSEIYQKLHQTLEEKKFVGVTPRTSATAKPTVYVKPGCDLALKVDDGFQLICFLAHPMTEWEKITEEDALRLLEAYAQ